jgi:hypothetical protein
LSTGNARKGSPVANDFNPISLSPIKKVAAYYAATFFIYVNTKYLNPLVSQEDKL